MKKLVILLILWSFTLAIAGDPCLDNPKSDIYTVDCEATYATEDLTANDWESIISVPTHSGEVTLQEIIKALEIAKRLIDVNEFHKVKVKLKQDRLEVRTEDIKMIGEKQDDYYFMISILDKLKKIRGEQ